LWPPSVPNSYNGRIRAKSPLKPGGKTGLEKPSAVILNQIRSVDSRRVVNLLGTVDSSTMRRWMTLSK